MGFKRFEASEIEKKEIDVKIEVKEIPKTEQVKKPPPPARPAIPIESEDEEIPEDATIDETFELDLSELPPPPPPPEEDDESANIFVAYDEPPQPITTVPCPAAHATRAARARVAGSGWAGACFSHRSAVARCEAKAAGRCPRSAAAAGKSEARHLAVDGGWALAPRNV